MTTKPMIAGHLEPAWADQADDVVHVEPGHLDGAWEMLPAKRLDETAYEICAIPFFVYDLNLGDRVETERRAIPGSDDEVPVVGRVVEESGHWTFRIAFKTPEAAAARPKVVARLQEFGCRIEWNDETMCAVDVEGGRRYGLAVLDWLVKQEGKGKLEYETGRTRDPGPPSDGDRD